MQMEETDSIYDGTGFYPSGAAEKIFFRALKSQKYIGDITFESVKSNVYLREDKPNGRIIDLHIVMHNDTYSLIIEVVYSCYRSDVANFATKIAEAYACISKEFNNRNLLLGIAANTFNNDALKYAHKHGIITFHPDGQKIRADTSACTLLHPDTSA